MTNLMIPTAVRDNYPSRQSPEVQMLKRVDPVVHGAEGDGPLDRARLDEFEQRGFLQVDGLFDADEVTRMRDELTQLSADPEIQADERTITERGTDEVRSIFEVHEVSQLLRRVVTDPRVVDVASQILGSSVYLHQTRINYKPGFAGKEFYWHSDFETWHAEDGMPAPRALSASIALTDNLEQNGPLLIMPGSHHTFVTCVGETPEDHYRQSLQKQEIGVPDQTSLSVLADACGIESLLGAAGSVVFFDSNCMHGSNGNITPAPRSNVFVVYNSVENTLEEPFGADRPRPSFIANRDPQPLA